MSYPPGQGGRMGPPPGNMGRPPGNKAGLSPRAITFLVVAGILALILVIGVIVASTNRNCSTNPGDANYSANCSSSGGGGFFFFGTGGGPSNNNYGSGSSNRGGGSGFGK